MTTPARAEANRRNAQKSTGPRTAEGKARSRLNGLTHGLRSEEVVLPTESREAFDAHLGRWMADWGPPTEARRHLVERAAVAAWRLRRCTRIETGRMARRAEEAALAWDRDRAGAVEAAVRDLAEPEGNARALAALGSTRDGVDRLAGLWHGLAGALDRDGGWNDDDHHRRLLALLGVPGPDGPLGEVVARSWSLLLAVRPDLAGPGDGPTPPGRVDAVRSILAGFCRGMAEGLTTRRPGLPDPAAGRAAVGEDAAFTFDAQDLHLQRHEARLDREARLAIAQLARLAQTGADLRDPDRAEAVEDEVEDVAPPAPAPNEPNPDPAPTTPTEPNDTPPAGSIRTADRADGRPIWDPPAWPGVPEGMPLS